MSGDDIVLGNVKGRGVGAVSGPVSRKLVNGIDGTLWVVTGNPQIGYTAQEVTLGEPVPYQRSWPWQAIEHSHSPLTADGTVTLHPEEARRER